MTDEETVMVYLAVSMMQDDAKEHVRGFLPVLSKLSSKIEKHIKDNPMMLDGLIKIIKSDKDVMKHPKAADLLSMLEHIVAAIKIVDGMKNETEECSLCDGNGKFTNGSGLPCPRCGGSGKLNKKETYN